jgi:copper chaperone
MYFTACSLWANASACFGFVDFFAKMIALAKSPAYQNPVSLVTMKNLELSIEGMTCGGCIKRVRGVFERLTGVRVVTVALGSAMLELGDTTPAMVLEELSVAGYDATIVS